MNNYSGDYDIKVYVPYHVGVYQVLYSHNGRRAYSYWDGKVWGRIYDFPEIAERWRGIKSYDIAYGHSVTHFRGLAANPEEQ